MYDAKTLLKHAKNRLCTNCAIQDRTAVSQHEVPHSKQYHSSLKLRKKIC